jgi:adenine-specific DNA methylase
MKKKPAKAVSHARPLKVRVGRSLHKRLEEYAAICDQTITSTVNEFVRDRLNEEDRIDKEFEEYFDALMKQTEFELRRDGIIGRVIPFRRPDKSTHQ